METSLFDTIFRDDTGKIVIAQPPNLTLSAWIGASLLQLVFTEGLPHQTLEIIAFSSLLIWALQELFTGVNYFRRGLGLLVFISLIATKIQDLLYQSFVA